MRKLFWLVTSTMLFLSFSFFLRENKNSDQIRNSINFATCLIYRADKHQLSDIMPTKLVVAGGGGCIDLVLDDGGGVNILCTL